MPGAAAGDALEAAFAAGCVERSLPDERPFDERGSGGGGADSSTLRRFVGGSLSVLAASPPCGVVPPVNSDASVDIESIRRPSDGAIEGDGDATLDAEAAAPAPAAGASIDALVPGVFDDRRVPVPTGRTGAAPGEDALRGGAPVGGFDLKLPP